MAEVRRKREYYAGRDVRTEVLAPERLKALEPNLRGGMAGGLLVPEDAVIYPPCAARFLLERARKNGAKIFIGLATEMGSGRVRLADGSEFTGNVIVNAGGAWSPQMTVGVEIKKRKGHLVITDRYRGFLRHQL